VSQLKPLLLILVSLHNFLPSTLSSAISPCHTAALAGRVTNLGLTSAAAEHGFPAQGLAAQGFFTAHGFAPQGLAAQGFLVTHGFAAQGLAPQGFFPAQGFAAQGFAAASVLDISTAPVYRYSFSGPAIAL